MQELKTKSTPRNASRRYTVNLRLLLISVAIAAILLPTALFWYKHRVTQNAGTFLDRANQLKSEEKWRDAATYYQRYLLVRTADTEALIDLIEVYDHFQSDARQLGRVNSLLYRALGQAPDRDDLRLKLAENLLRMNNFGEAQREARKLLESAPQHEAAAQKIIALSMIVPARSDQEIADAVGALRNAAKSSPGDAALIEVTANAIREHFKAIELDEVQAATEADQLIDELVAADSKNVAARLARYRYRTRHKLADADPDLAAALKIDPENVDAILFSAAAISSALDGGENDSNNVAQAKNLLQRAIKASPYDPRPYLALAAVKEQANDHDGLLELLKRGREVSGNPIEFGLATARVQINENKLEDAKESLDELEAQSAAWLAQLDSPSRDRLRNRLSLLHARLSVAQGRFDAGISKLRSILLAARTNESAESVQATKLLAIVESQLGRWDLAGEDWGKLLELFPADETVIGPAAHAFLQSGNPRQAIEAIEKYKTLSHSASNADLSVALVQAHLLDQLGRSPAAQNWAEFESKLAAAKSQSADRWELVLAEINYLMAIDDKRAAVARLRGSEQTFADQAPFWRIAALAYQRLEQSDDVQRALAKHHELTDSAFDRAALDAAVLVVADEHRKADQLLADLPSPATVVERRQIGRMRVEALWSGGFLDDALKVAVDLLGPTETQDATLLKMGVELALANNRLDLAEAWEKSLLEVDHNSSEARYYKARRLLQSYSAIGRQQRQELQDEIALLRSERPRWPLAVALAAQYERLQGNSRRAMADYQLAVDLGDRRTFTLQQLVSLFYEDGRFADAEKYLSLVAQDERNNTFVSTMAAELAVKQDRKQQALKLARESVQRSPDDVPRQLYLANLLVQLGESQEALETLQRAAEQFPDKPDVWSALFNAYLQTGQKEQARAALVHLVEGSILPEDRRHFVAAQGYQRLGEYGESQKQYELAVAQQPMATDVRMKYAQMLSARNPQAAREQYERVLRTDSLNSQATRELALLLAATGKDADWERATRMLDAVSQSATSQGASGDAKVNDRLRAMLLSQKGRTRSDRIANCELARGILQQLLESDAGEASATDHLLLAQILEREAALAESQTLVLAARDQLRAAVDQGAPSPQRLSLYIEFLIRHATAPADQPTEKPAAENQSPAANDWRETFLSEADSRIKELTRLQTAQDDGVAALTVALTSRLLQARGNDAEAKQHIAAYIAREMEKQLDKGDTAKRYLAAGRLYASVGAEDEAEKWYRRLMESTPSAYVLVVQSLLNQGKRREAMELTLQVASVKPTPDTAILLANIMTVTDSQSEDVSESQVKIESVIQKHGDNVDVLQAEAVMRASRGEYDEAIAAFRRILEIDPSNAVAMNNLATLLAERPNERAEALKVVQRAIEIAGRNPTLLDTEGTIFLKLKDAKQAIASLEEATAGGTADARYYLHLAAAYQLAERNADALAMLNEARAFGLEKFVLTDDDRDLLKMLDERLAPVAGNPKNLQ